MAGPQLNTRLKRWNLPKKQVVITTKPGKTLSDVKIKEVMTYSGYTMGQIHRAK